MKSPILEAQCAEDGFQIQSPICGANFSNIISITEVSVSERKTEVDFIFNLLNINLKKKSFHNSIDWCKGLFSSVSPTMAGGKFQIYSVQINGKCFYETLTPLCMIWSLVPM